MEQTGKADIQDIARRGFNEIILCVTELDLASKARLKLLKDLVAEAERNGLHVVADPWRLGGIFGGEGISFYEQNGGKPDDPALGKLTEDWLDAVVDAGIKSVLWDEPEVMSGGQDRSMDYLKKYTALAKEKGIEQNVVVVRARERSVTSADAVATLPSVDGIAVAPYPFHPGNKNPKSASQVLDYVTPWFEATEAAAQRHGKTAQAWLQGFNITPENLPTLKLTIEAMRKAGIENVAVWGYRGAQRVDILNPQGTLDPIVVWDETSHLVGKYVSPKTV